MVTNFTLSNIAQQTELFKLGIVVYWPSTRPNMPFQRQRKWLIPMASNRKKSRRRVWLTIWDKVKSRSTVTDWCTGREWPVNCMTVISARWQSNMPFQRQRKWHILMASYGEILSGWLNYYITVKTVSQLVWRSDPLVTRCGWGSQHPAKSWAPRPTVVHLWRTRKTQHRWPYEWGGQYIAVLFGL